MNPADIATIVGVIILLYKAFTMTPKEANAVDAGTLKCMEEVVTSSMERSLKLNERVLSLENSEAALKKQIGEKDSTIGELTNRIQELEGAFDRLTLQVKSLGAVPVAEKPKRRKVATDNSE